MSETLKQVLDDYYKTIKEGRANYRACYNSFLEYCDKYINVPLFEMSKALTKIEIKYACKYYFEKSKKATTIEAIQRYLTAIDQFYKYIKKQGITWEHLEGGCRNKQIVHDICVSLNDELTQKIYLPFDEEKAVKIAEEQIALLNRDNFFQLGQSVIYRMLSTYGFKEKVITNFKMEDFSKREETLLISGEEEQELRIKLDEDILADLVRYCELHKYPDRTYLFTKSNGTQLTPNSIFITLKERMKKLDVSNFTPTTVALQGVVNLIEKGLTLQEIKILTKFETQKIEDVSKYLLTDEDAEKVINEKLQKEIVQTQKKLELG
ncbi:MAG TPA: hypothetical protein H9742_07920 [Candidatus Acetatifactor stercoripullorum]|uniref:Uncharacterized protein n=1 Tax=Candidatus Acetatifactor stercoripullorum TaxID=2838414 RepID=A0A9D1R6J6_9FIRM|nr:hypothetical protein [uncultured Acetatifactor sp.]HIW81428.1 hypothetical protein [Candidatus Acetatifactor stercoripullorum]